MMRTLNEKEQHKDLTNPRRYPTEDSQNSLKKKEKSTSASQRVYARREMYKTTVTAVNDSDWPIPSEDTRGRAFFFF